jgi:hypothetical protein
LQKSIVSYSIPKATRFTNLKLKSRPGYVNLRGLVTSGSKGTSFGFGVRSGFPLQTRKIQEDIPAPKCYTSHQVETRMTQKLKGVSFGLPRT